MSSFYENEKLKSNNKEKEMKLPSLEERMLNLAKKDINILINEPQFISLFKYDNDKKENNNDKLIENNSNLDDSNKKESTIAESKNKEPLFRQIQNKQVNKWNNSIDSILPSISNNKYLNRNSSNIKNNIRKKKYSFSLNSTNEKNKINLNRNSFNKSNTFKNYIQIKKQKESPKTYIKLNKKFNNFYEIKNDYNKKKYRFYNDKELFGFNESKNNINIRITNFKESKNKSNDIDAFAILKNQDQIIKIKK